ncbi:MAG: flavodoxin-dependent (E)-4-hydroxy-3-methylbut-2-enyl-diphosphate synthase [Lachnospiraceae bacterium]|nr:flavodoxin-dependent (E)-4-hydroxy-3-methylbut-2-enyl-diphosphate synthase [Lachnospiraceae bacterium]
MERKKTRVVSVAGLNIGGDNPVVIQSMCNTRTEDVEATVSQILKLEEAGCELIRVTVPTEEAAHALSDIKSRIHIPLVADIHFDYRLAILAIENGADKIRINPGNIGSEDRVKAVVEKAKEYNVPIRVGVNSGSLERELLMKYGGVTAEAIVESAMNKVKMLEKYDFNDIVISIKSSDVLMTIKSYELISEMTDYPLHVGVTESGSVTTGNIKSAIGIGTLLYEGIGDTIRVSLTDDPVEEIYSAKTILKALGLRNAGVEVVSCPTCGRTAIDLFSLAKKVEDYTRNFEQNIKVAVMGCVVNGPGEGRNADLGICGGKGEGLIIKKGEVIAKVPEEELFERFKEEFSKLL